uniref:C-type lectin domain-containing protein n=1 Tax=Anopheles dirus TaxID=7168 RepID=A0A182N2M6_9DIPT
MNAVLRSLLIVGLVGTHALRYTVHNTPVDFYEAWMQCMAKGGYLAAIETALQNAMVLEAVKKAGGPEFWWIAGTDNGLEGVWIWMSRNLRMGSVSGYVNWMAGEPSNTGTGGENCAAIGSAGTWSDKPCTNTYKYVCEYYTA